MKRYHIISVVALILPITLFCLWHTTNGYFNFNSCIKKSDVIEVLIYDQKAYIDNVSKLQESNQNHLNQSELISTAKKQSMLLLLTNAIEINKFISALDTRLFSFTFTNCKCSGEIIVKLTYSNKKTYEFGIAHKTTLKMPNFKDWPLSNEFSNWAKINLPN